MSFPIRSLFDKDDWEMISIWYILDLTNGNTKTIAFTEYDIWGHAEREADYIDKLNISKEYMVRVPISGKIYHIYKK